MAMLLTRARLDRSPAGPWAATAARLVLAAVLLGAGALKAGDPAAAGRALAAYRLLPYEAALAIGGMLPFLEIMLGALLLVGFVTRAMAALAGLLLVIFMAAIVSVWARGLSISCGCFGDGGAVADPVQGYVVDLLRDAVLVAGAVYLVLGPDSKFALDDIVLPAKEIR